MLHAVIMAVVQDEILASYRQVKPKTTSQDGKSPNHAANDFRSNGRTGFLRTRVGTHQSTALRCGRIATADLPLEHVIGEPFKRDTAPCIGVAAIARPSSDKDGIMVVMPSITIIESKASFIGRFGLALSS